MSDSSNSASTRHHLSGGGGKTVQTFSAFGRDISSKQQSNMIDTYHCRNLKKTFFNLSIFLLVWDLNSGTAVRAKHTSY